MNPTARLLTPVFACISILSACARGHGEGVVSGESAQAIADTIRGILETTYRFDSGAVVQRFMRVYPSSGRVVSAASGGFTESRDSLESALHAFWEGTGKYMVDPTWKWGPMAIEVLSPRAAVVTARYTIPHWTPDGNPHVLGGVWTSVWMRNADHWAIIQEHLSDLPRPAAERLEAEMPRRKAP
jgi:hypothetical protein